MVATRNCLHRRITKPGKESWLCCCCEVIPRISLDLLARAAARFAACCWILSTCQVRQLRGSEFRTGRRGPKRDSIEFRGLICMKAGTLNAIPIGGCLLVYLRDHCPVAFYQTGIVAPSQVNVAGLIDAISHILLRTSAHKHELTSKKHHQNTKTPG